MEADMMKNKPHNQGLKSTSLPLGDLAQRYVKKL